MKSEGGFSLIEMLAATVILGVLVTVVLAPLTQLFRNTGTSSRTLNVTTQAQELVEAVRGQWQSYPDVRVGNIDQNTLRRADSRNRYDRTCATLPPVTGATSTVTVQALDRNANASSALSLSSSCTGAVNSAPLKRVIVAVVAADGTRSTLTIDVPRP